MIRFCITLLFFHTFYASALQATEDLRGRFVDFDVSKDYYAGDGHILTLAIWPTTRNPENFKVLKGKIGDSFYLAEILSLERSEYNHEAVILEGRFIFLSGFRSGIAEEVQKRHFNLLLETPNINFIRKDNIGPEYEFVDQDYWRDLNLIPYILASLILLMGFIFFLRRWYVRFRAEKKYRETRIYWINIFIKSKTRQDFEFILEKKEEWINYLAINPLLGNFLEEVKDLQYQREWSEVNWVSLNDKMLQIKKYLEENYRGERR